MELRRVDLCKLDEQRRGRVVICGDENRQGSAETGKDRSSNGMEQFSNAEEKQSTDGTCVVRRGHAK